MITYIYLQKHGNMTTLFFAMGAHYQTAKVSFFLHLLFCIKSLQKNIQKS